MNCPYCGAKLGIDTSICRSCGMPTNPKDEELELEKLLEKEEEKKVKSKKKKCQIHQEKAIKTCKICKNPICKDCDSILEEIEKHNKEDKLFENINKDICLDCALKELSSKDYKSIIKNRIIYILITIVTYLIGIYLFFTSIPGLKLINIAFSIVLMGMASIIKSLGFNNEELCDGDDYNIKVSALGNVKVSSGNSPDWKTIVLGIITTPIMLYHETKLLIKQNKIYSFQKQMITKLERLLNKSYHKEVTKKAKNHHKKRSPLSIIITVIVLFYLIQMIIGYIIAIKQKDEIINNPESYIENQIP